MQNPWFIIGAVVAALLLLLLAAIIVFGFGRALIGVIVGLRDERKWRAKEVTVPAPFLGSIQSMRSGVWVGRMPDDSPMPGVEVFLEGSSTAPPLALCERAAGLAEQLPRLIELARPLLEAEAVEWEMPPATAWNLDAVHVHADPTAFRLDFSRDDDADGIWFVEFKESRPVSSGRDD